MKPRGPLMVEHRLIEKMLKIIGEEIRIMKNSGRADPVFIDTMVDFIRTYADRTHHGKEEDILFKELGKKELHERHQVMMDALVDDHIYARALVAELVDSREEYAGGVPGSLEQVIEKLDMLIKFYPVHIRKEDEEFFPETESYFSSGELAVVLEKFKAFDSRMIHEKYEKLHISLSGKYK